MRIMMKNYNKLLLIGIAFILQIYVVSCDDDPPSEDTGNGGIELPDDSNSNGKLKIIQKVTIYIENSGSMSGYVNGPTNFVNVVNEFAQWRNLVGTDTKYSFYFISGEKKAVQSFFIGDNPESLATILTVSGLKKETSGWSDLNEIFKKVLKAANHENVSILFSDGIYDVGKYDRPLMRLATEGKTTRTTFIERLYNENIETLIIKLESHFHGTYCHGSADQSEPIDHIRPYYIWIFGNAELLNKYYPEDRLQSLNGFVDLARFQKLQSEEIPYQGIGYENIGLRANKKEKNVFELTHNVTDSSKFTIAVDFSSLHMSDSYLTNIDNFKGENGYLVKNVYRPNNATTDKFKYYLNNLPFTPTHFITIITPNPPYIGNINISLLNILPGWITETGTESDFPLNRNTSQTFGFNTLTKGISEGYEEVSNTEFLSLFEITIKK